MALSLRNPETQAKLSGVLIASSLVLLLAALALAFQRFNWTLMSFVYSSDGLRRPIIYAIGFVSLMLSAGAFWFSYASAGERRNSYSRLSWICFASSAAVIVITLVFMAANQFMVWTIQ